MIMEKLAINLVFSFLMCFQLTTLSKSPFTEITGIRFQLFMNIHGMLSQSLLCDKKFITWWTFNIWLLSFMSRFTMSCQCLFTDVFFAAQFTCKSDPFMYNTNVLFNLTFGRIVLTTSWTCMTFVLRVAKIVKIKWQIEYLCNQISKILIYIFRIVVVN